VKKLVLLALMLAMLLTTAVPTLAQEGNTKDGPLPSQGETPKGDTVDAVRIFCAPGFELVKGDDPSGREDKCAPKTPEDQPPEPPGPPPSVEETDLVAQLTVECPENAGNLAGYQLVTTGVESLTAVPLTDEDGDGVLTGTQTFPRFPPGPLPRPPDIEPIMVDDARIVAPDGSTVKQFGPVKLNQDEIILPATISFCDGGSGGSDGNSNNGGSSDGGGPAGGAKTLPATGGALPITGLLGALLVGGGLLVRRMVR